MSLGKGRIWRHHMSCWCHPCRCRDGFDHGFFAHRAASLVEAETWPSQCIVNCAWWSHEETRRTTAVCIRHPAKWGHGCNASTTQLCNVTCAFKFGSSQPRLPAASCRKAFTASLMFTTASTPMPCPGRRRCQSFGLLKQFRFYCEVRKEKRNHTSVIVFFKMLQSKPFLVVFPSGFPENQTWSGRGQPPEFGANSQLAICQRDDFCEDRSDISCRKGYAFFRFSGDSVSQVAITRRIWRIFWHISCAFGSTKHSCAGPLEVPGLDSKTLGV